MKNLYLILISFIISFSSVTQVNRSDYSSKWFLGFNTGVTWSSSDVDNSWKWRENSDFVEYDNYRMTIPSGWGLTLGKSFNYDYGRIFSFDIRGRYLRGHWYGQNSEMDSISMENYDSSADLVTAEQIQQAYQDENGGYIHNYEVDLHRLSLELVLHLNRLREKTRIDPYIFGGVGLTFKKTRGDLYSGEYLYTQSELENNDLDFIFETELNPEEKLIHFMPSLGFGIGYQVSPRFSVGLEHKTTFTLKDQFDGVISEIPRLDNDWYHYTSGYLRFRLGGKGSSSSSSSNTATNTTNTNCPEPKVLIYNSQNKTVSTKTIQINALLKNINSVSEIKLMDANRALLPFDFDSYSNKLTATVNLVPGSNTFYVKANNSCGTDMARLNVVYSDCILPEGNFNNPSNNNLTVDNSNYEIKAHFTNLKSAAMIKMYVNNVQIYAFSFDVTTGTLESNISLELGSNFIRIDFENSCGSGSITSNITFEHCTNPSINLVNPSASGSTTNLRDHVIHANIIGPDIEQKNIETKLNGKLLDKSDERNWTYNNGTLKFSIVLINGINNIEIEVSNDCGTETYWRYIKP